jgi:hypothetical protein
MRLVAAAWLPEPTAQHRQAILSAAQQLAACQGSRPGMPWTVRPGQATRLAGEKSGCLARQGAREWKVACASRRSAPLPSLHIVPDS